MDTAAFHKCRRQATYVESLMESLRVVGGDGAMPNTPCSRPPHLGTGGLHTLPTPECVLQRAFLEWYSATRKVRNENHAFLEKGD